MLCDIKILRLGISRTKHRISMYRLLLHVHISFIKLPVIKKKAHFPYRLNNVENVTYLLTIFKVSKLQLVVHCIYVVCYLPTG